MFKVKSTTNYGGMEIQGDYEDFDSLQDAIYDIADTEYNQYLGYGPISEAFLGLAYDIRHAKQGDREFKQVDNGSSAWNVNWETGKKANNKINENNLYYSVRIPMIQLLFGLHLFEDLRKIRFEHLEDRLAGRVEDATKEFQDCKSEIERARLSDAKLLKMQEDMAVSMNRKVISREERALDDSIAFRYNEKVFELFREAVYKALSEVVGAEDFLLFESICKKKRELKSDLFEGFLTQFAEDIEIQYLNTTKAKRKKTLLEFMMQIMNFQHDAEYLALEKVIRKEALKKGNYAQNVRFQYDFDWVNIKW